MSVVRPARDRQNVVSESVRGANERVLFEVSWPFVSSNVYRRRGEISSGRVRVGERESAGDNFHRRNRRHRYETF